MARCQYMLQEGNPTSDILYYVGEDAPVDPEGDENLHPAIPFGYDYDFCNRDILESVEVKDGKLVLPNGLEYAVLTGLKSEHIRPEVLKVLQKLIKEGAVVVASKPTRVPGLNNTDAANTELHKLTAEIWGEVDGKTVLKNNYGKGAVYMTESIFEACKDYNLLPDFEFTLDNADEYGKTLFPGNGMEFIHRNTAQTDVYFVSNQHYKAKTIKAKFRISDKSPELWNAETGDIITAQEYRKLDDGRMEVTLRMEEAGAVFVVFRKALTAESANDFKPTKTIEKLTFTAPWNVSFDGNGAPLPMVMKTLKDISQYKADDVKYFSGTISYKNQINIEELKEGAKMTLDLGEVNVIAKVFINGKLTGTLWKYPFSIDVTDALKKGKNDLKIDVANLWVNRIIGDQKLPEDCEWTTNTGSTAAGLGLVKVPDWVIEGKESPTGRQAFVGWKWEHFETKELLPSGLVGPVSIRMEIE